VKQLVESSLSRLWETMKQNDTGLITAFRHEYKYKENQQRNTMLLADLRKNYDITPVKGSYIENYGTSEAVEVGENVFFVSDSSKLKNLEGELARLGTKYDQDSVLYVPEGGTKGVLIGLKEGGYPPRGESFSLDHPVFGKEGQFMTKIRNRPFVFTENEDITLKEHLRNGPRGFFGEWGRFLTTRLKGR
jgi:hypothetical protein